MHMMYVWLAVIVVCLLVELIADGTLISLWFSIGAVIPFCISLGKNDSVAFIVTEVVIFGIVSALCLIFLRKIAKRTLYKNTEKTNLDALVGKTVKIISVDEDADIAIVKLNGIEYTAVGENNETFKVKEEVEIIKFKGNKIIIKKKEEE